METKIRRLEEQQEEADASNKHKDLKLKIRMELEELYKLKSSMLCQKARMNWSLKGEKH